MKLSSEAPKRTPTTVSLQQSVSLQRVSPNQAETINAVDRESSPSDVALAGSRKRPSPCEFECEEPTSKRHSSDSTHLEEDLSELEYSIKRPFTDGFFSSMASVIYQEFPIYAFAAMHDCDAQDVLRALHAVVLTPLRNPQAWHQGISISEHAQMMITSWILPKAPRTEKTPSSPQISLGSQQSPILIADDSSLRLSSDDSSESLVVEIDNPYFRPYSGRPSFGSDHSPAPETRTHRSRKKARLLRTRPEQGSVHSAPAALEADLASEKKVSIPIDSSDKVNLKTSSLSAVDRSRIDRKSPVTRIECRKSADGSWIPLHKWIEGHHRPADLKTRHIPEECYEDA